MLCAGNASRVEAVENMRCRSGVTYNDRVRNDGIRKGTGIQLGFCERDKVIQIILSGMTINEKGGMHIYSKI